MTIDKWLFDANIRLAEAEVDAPRTDCIVLLEHVLQKDRAWILAHGDGDIPDSSYQTISHLLDQRVQRIPLAYIVNSSWFYGRTFYVNEHVLIPRPESEDLITLAKEMTPHAMTAADIGTGSGCLAITLALELHVPTITAVDVSQAALEVARKNSYSHNVKIRFMESYLLDDIPKDVELIVANLPYVPDDLVTSPEIEKEPKVALFSGNTGLDHYQSFWAQVGGIFRMPNSPIIITESLTSQHNDMVTLAASAEYHLVHTLGLCQGWQRN